MIDYMLTRLRVRISPSRGLKVFNTNKLSQHQYIPLLKKSGVSCDGVFKVVPPLYFEFANINIANNAFINANCVFVDNAPISIGENSRIGPNVTLCTSTHALSPDEREHEEEVISKPISIGKNVWLGAGTVVLLGVDIGDNSIIGANSVVNCNIPKNQMWAGSPAVFKKNLC